MSRVSGAATLLSLALGLTLFAAPMTAEVAVADPVVAPIPVIDWGSCDEAPDVDEFECATVPVPLDYDDPTGPTVDLDLLRVQATNPAQRIGTLFVNPGGPGGSSRFFATFFGEIVPAEVSQRFDIVGIDPRGVGPSAVPVCRTDEKRPPYPYVSFPVTNARDQATDHLHQVAAPRVPRRRQPDHRPHEHRRHGPRHGPDPAGAGRRRSSATTASPTAPSSARRTPRCSPTRSAR